MKVRDSGMPPEEMWTSYFNVENILDRMQVNKTVNNLLEVGCGYGTFTISASKKITGKLFAFDIEKEMIDHIRIKTKNEGLTNIEFFICDIIVNGSGLPAGTIDYVMLFNILHHDKPQELLGEAYKALCKQGKVGIIHWRTDIATPRGPDMSIRPKPEQCVEWAKRAGFKVIQQPEIVAPYHYGIVFEKIIRQKL